MMGLGLKLGMGGQVAGDPPEASAPTISGQPTISGTEAEGETLTATPSSASGYPSPVNTWQWERSGTPISGATSQTYVLVSADVDETLTVVQTATNSEGSDTAESEATGTIGAALAAPSITGSPTISGTETEGETLTATAASVTGNPTPTRTWQWERSGTPISGATSATYELVSADVGETLTVVQTETNSEGSDDAESSATGTITVAELITYPTGGAGSADFEGETIDDGWATDPGTDVPGFTGFAISDGRMVISLDAADDYDPGTANPGLGAPRIETNIGDVDFQLDIHAPFDPMAGQADYAGVGFVVVTASTSARFDIYMQDGARTPQAYIKRGANAAETPTVPVGTGLSIANSQGFPTHQRLIRSGDTWQWFVSYDGYQFEQVGTDISWAVTVADVGVMGYHIGSSVDQDIPINYIHVGGQVPPTINRTPTRVTAFTDDFTDLSNWSDESAGTGGSATVSSNVLTLACGTADGSTGRILSNDAFDDAQGVLFAAQQIGTAQSSIYLGVVLRGTGDWAGQYTTDFAFVLEMNHATDTIRIVRNVGEAAAEADGGYFTYHHESEPAAADLGDLTWCRFEAIGPIVRARFWNDGDPEPSTWAAVYDDTIRTAGKIGFALSHNDGQAVSGSVEITDVTVYEIPEATRDEPAAADETAPAFSSVSWNDTTKALSFTLTEESGSATVVWATADTAEDPTYTTGGGWSGTTYETGSYTAEEGANSDTISITGTTPDGSRELTLYAYDASENLSDVERVAITVDNSGPTVSSSSPADNATGVSTGGNITITFNENIAFGTGTIVLRENDGGWADLETFDVETDEGSGDGTVSISGDTLTINPTSSLSASTEYAIRIASTAIEDAYGNNFAGIANDTTLSFTTGASGGASGNYTFSLVEDQATTNPSTSTPNVTLSTALATGDGIFVDTFDRSGIGHANHAVSDDNGGSWTKIASYDNANGDANGRCSKATWFRAAGAGDNGDTLTITATFTGANGCLQASSYRPSAAYGWSLSGVSANGSGTSDWNGTASGDATASGNDIFERASAGARNASGSQPTTTNMNFATQTDGTTEHIGGNNQVTFFSAIEGTSTAEGTKSATLTSDGSGNEGVVLIATFNDGT